DQRDFPFRRREHGLQDEGGATIGSLDLRRRALRRDQPASVLRATEKGGEAGRRVESRQAEPVDGAVPSDERRGLTIADERIVLDRERNVAGGKFLVHDKQASFDAAQCTGIIPLLAIRDVSTQEADCERAANERQEST